MTTRLWPLSRPRSMWASLSVRCHQLTTTHRSDEDAGHFHDINEDKLEQLKRLTRELRFGQDVEEAADSGQSAGTGRGNTNDTPPSARSGGYHADEEDDWSGDERETRKDLETDHLRPKTEAWFEA